ncbi:Tkl protein kinase, partial [Globisporangium splendens]
MVLLSAVLIGYLRYHRHEAFQGNSSAARKIILPAFEPLLWVIAFPSFASLVGFIIILAVPIQPRNVPLWVSECFNSGRYFVLLIVPVLMLQKSVSFAALRRAVLVTPVLSTYAIPIDWAARRAKGADPRHPSTSSAAHALPYVATAARFAIMLLYGYVYLHPPARGTKRTLREYCIYAAIYQSMLMVSKHLSESRRRHKGQYELMYVSMVWALIGPIVVWRVLKADTEHWRGWGQSAWALQRPNSKNTSIAKRISSEGLHVLIEMHRKHIIDFAALQFRQRIGLGTNSIVYQGVLHSKTAVAVKVYTPKEFSEEVIADFSHEAALCGSLHRPNIVTFYGMCVCPPTICLVSELCQGSLDHVTMVMANSHDRFLMRTRASTDKREHVLINLGFMLDAARSIAYLHNFSPTFVHRDIKPSNFLVDAANNVKLTDFGESRCLPRSDAHVQVKSVKGKKYHSNLDNDKDQLSPTARTAVLRMRSSSLTTPSSDFPHRFSCDLTVKGTVDYMVPEVIQGHAGLASYGEAADIYSLGVTFWDILHPGCEKFPHLKNNHLHIFEAILDGERPKFDYRHADRDAELHHVIELAWQTEPERRPSAQHLVRMLERIQERECARFAGELRYDILAEKENETSIAAASRPRFSIQSSGSGSSALTQSATVTGNHVVATMVKAQLVQSRREGLRMGNMLMDAGMLHHLKHTRPFEGDSMYFFDQACIHSYEPPAISILGDTRGNSDMEAGARTNSFDEARRSQPDHVGFAPQHAPLPHNHPRAMDTRPLTDSTPILSDTTGRACRCRALSQRLEQPKTSVHRKILQKIKGGHTTAGDASTPFLEDYAVTANLLIVKNDDDDNSEEDISVHVEQN